MCGFYLSFDLFTFFVCFCRYFYVDISYLVLKYIIAEIYKKNHNIFHDPIHTFHNLKFSFRFRFNRIRIFYLAQQAVLNDSIRLTAITNRSDKVRWPQRYPHGIYP